MRQTRLTLALIALTSVVLFSCQKDISVKNPTEAPELMETNCSNPTPPPPPAPAPTYCGSTTVTLLADRTDNVGSVTIGNDGTNLYVTYTLTNNYKVEKTRVYVGSLALMPKNSNGSPNTNNFPYKTTHSPAVSSYTYTIPLSSLTSTCNAVVVYAEVTKANAWGWTCYDEVGWAQGTLIAANCSWSMYNNYCTVSCTPPDQTPPDK
ncbi:MAG TPA: hypothetical protein VLJ68_13780 [Chitinophagaceae bacterium]|nr:hypothetical protein [Chitinophagaceae bacterium]